MPSLNFQPRFVPDIEKGIKRQTIREDIPFWQKLKPGDKLFLFTGLRTKNVRTLITPYSFQFMYGMSNVFKYPGLRNNPPTQFPLRKRPYVVCKSVERVGIDKYCVDFITPVGIWSFAASSPNAQFFAEADGFKDYSEMVKFFDALYGLPFKGLIIKWG